MNFYYIILFYIILYFIILYYQWRFKYDIICDFNIFLKKDLSADSMKDKISKFVVKKHMPLDLVENEEFISFVHFLNSMAAIHMPKADCMAAHVMTKYFESKNKRQRECFLISRK